jgi:hypothetical protein
VAEAKLNSWDSFFEQKQTELAEVQQQMGSVDIQTTDKIVSPQTSIAEFYESQRDDLKKAKIGIKQSKDAIRDKVRKIFAQGVMELTGKAKV